MDRGFDFGFQMRVMAAPDPEFNQALRDARVIGCGYGFQRLDGISQTIPCITLVGTNKAAFLRAYQEFVRWGCEEDGDVIDVNLLLQADGGYNLWIGPEIERTMYRTIPQSALFDTMVMGLSWIKHIDSTNAMVHEIKRYCSTGLHPVFIYAALGNPDNPSSGHVKLIPEWKGILKFDLKIIEQANAPSGSLFAASRERSSKRQSQPESKLAPEDLHRRRLRTLDTAFPVSRERVRRSSLVDEVRRLPGFDSVTDTQVVQGAINLMMSAELVAGDRHYRQLTGDVDKAIWSAIASRVEFADGGARPADMPPSLVAKQVELDVKAALTKLKERNLHEAFPRLQEIFRSKACVDD